MADLGAILLAVSERARMGLVITAVREGVVEGVYLSDSAVEIFGHPREALMTKNLLYLCIEEERPRVAEIVRRIAAREPVEPYLETVIEQANGRRVDIHVTLVDIEHGGRALTVNIVTDITAQRNAQRVVLASQARFRHLIEAVPDAILVIDRNGSVVYANGAAGQLLGYENAAELIGTPPPMWLALEDEQQIRLDAAGLRPGESAVPKEYRASRRDGVKLVVECTALLIDFEGDPSLVVFARDVTERRRVQEHLARTDRLAALGTLAAGVAHEINNPLAFMTLNVDVLQRIVANEIPDAAAREHALRVVSDVRSGADRVAAIVRDLRMFSRDDETEDATVEIPRVIAAAQRLIMHELQGRARLIVDLPVMPPVKASASRLEQVFVNLLLNAAQAFESASDRNEIRVTGGVLMTGNVYVDVSDNGPGIAPELLARIFDPFFTTKPLGVGTGLGLSICHGILSRLGGELTVTSEVGRGTTFRVTLLPGTAAALPNVTSTEAPPPSKAHGRVLLVDDEPAIARSLQVLLEEEHEVDVVTTGEQAISKILQAEPPYDVVFCDVTMRAAGGAEVYDRVAKVKPGLEDRIVFMTGGPTSETTRGFLARVPNIRIRKPFSLRVIDSALHAVMGR